MAYYTGTLPQVGDAYDVYPTRATSAWQGLDNQLYTVTTAQGLNTTFRQGYSTFTAGFNAKKLAAAVTVFRETQDWYPSTTYSQVRGASLAFTASGNATNMEVSLRFSLSPPTSGTCFLHFLLKRNGVQLGQKQTCSSAATFDNPREVAWVVAASTGTYTVEVRAYGSSYSAYIGKVYYLDGATQASYYGDNILKIQEIA